MDKYSLDQNFLVDVIYKEDLLPEDNTLIDVAYSYNWRKVNTFLLPHVAKPWNNFFIFADQSNEVLLQNLPKDQGLDAEAKEEEYKD